MSSPLEAANRGNGFQDLSNTPRDDTELRRRASVRAIRDELAKEINLKNIDFDLDKDGLLNDKEKRLKDLLASWDKDASGTITVGELLQAAENHYYTQQSVGQWKKISVTMLGVVVLLLLSVLALGVAAAELAKDTRIKKPADGEDTSVMTDKNDKPVATAGSTTSSGLESLYLQNPTQLNGLSQITFAHKDLDGVMKTKNAKLAGWDKYGVGVDAVVRFYTLRPDMPTIEIAATGIKYLTSDPAKGWIPLSEMHKATAARVHVLAARAHFRHSVNEHFATLQGDGEAPPGDGGAPPGDGGAPPGDGDGGAPPTETPTPAPTTAPTPAPTTAPTPAPTTAPTPAPTTAPTPAPTTAPTPAPTTAPTGTPEPTSPIGWIDNYVGHAEGQLNAQDQKVRKTMCKTCSVISGVDRTECCNTAHAMFGKKFDASCSICQTALVSEACSVCTGPAYRGADGQLTTAGVECCVHHKVQLGGQFYAGCSACAPGNRPTSTAAGYFSSFSSDATLCTKCSALSDPEDKIDACFTYRLAPDSCSVCSY